MLLLLLMRVTDDSTSLSSFDGVSLLLSSLLFLLSVIVINLGVSAPCICKYPLHSHEDDTKDDDEDDDHDNGGSCGSTDRNWSDLDDDLDDDGNDDGIPSSIVQCSCTNIYIWMMVRYIR